MNFSEKQSSEKRLIDANALIEEANADGAYGYVDAKQIADAPTIDAVEVVRCEKCKHAVWDEEIKMWRCVESAEYDEEMGGYFGVCEYHYGDFFCFYGKRKDGDWNANANL